MAADFGFTAIGHGQPVSRGAPGPGGPASYTGTLPKGDPLTTGFIFAIETALKKQLAGMTCSNRKGDPLPVQVYYAMPEQERRVIEPPVVTITLMSIQPAYARMHSMNPIDLPYVPGVGRIEDGTLHTTFPIPLDITYSVQSYTRTALHDREVMIQVMHPGRLPYRHLGLPLPDGTIREMHMASGPTPTDFVDEQQRRVFRKTWTISVAEEVLVDQLPQLIASVPVNVVHIHLRGAVTLDVINDPNHYVTA